MRTLLCIRDLPYAEPTVKFCGVVTSALDSEVDVLSIRPESESTADGEAIVEQAIELLPTPPGKRMVRHGTPLEGIIAEVQSKKYDLVVVGAHDLPTVSQLFLGCIARKVVAQIDTSVLVVRNPSFKLEKILLTTGGHEASEPTITVGGALAHACQAQVTLLHVVGSLPHMYSGIERMEEHITDLLKTDTPIANHLKESAEFLCSRGVETEIELRRGTPAEEILRASEVEDYDLLVVGGSSRSGINKLLFDEVSLQIVDHAPRSVLVVKEDFVK